VKLVRILGRSLALATIVGVTLFAGACGPSRAPVQMLRSLEERRAQAIIERTFADHGVQPAPGRVLKLSDGSEIREELAIAGSPYGVAYVTEQEAQKHGKALPPHDPNNDQLRLIRPNENAVVLLLYQTAYRFDAGEAHSVTAVTAENQLAKDVADFVTHVVRQNKGL
jgi:hypothetical protein